MNNKNIISSFNTKGFDVINYIYAKDCIIYYVSKDYAKKFNINFDGNIILEVKIRFEFFKFLTPDFYPTFKEISKSVVENIKIPVPELKLQEEFSKFVEQTHRQKLTIQQSLDKLEVLRKSLMQEYFR